ncbi:MAG: hypothetical protein KDC80_08805 [Saprospiraceae bacterium]|nr:hypothetical protein [Saprospiraceae bacterium]
MSKGTADRFRDPLEDQGWQQMKKLLDREMPERKKRIIWWPWLGVASVLLILVVTFANRLDQPEMNQDIVTGTGSDLVPSTDDQKLAEPATLPGDEEISSTSGADRDVIKKRNALGTEVTSIRSGKIDSDQKPETQTNGSASGDEIEEVENNPDRTVSMSILPEPQESGKPGGLQDDIPTGTDTELISAGKIVEQRKFDPLFSLGQSQNYLGHRYAISSEISQMDLSGSPIQRKKQSGFDFGFAGALLMERSFKKPSIDLGIDFRYKPVKYLAIGTGLYFWQIRSNQTFTATDNASGLLGAFQNALGDALVAIPEMQNQDTLDRQQPGNTTYIQTIKSISYLRIPIYLELCLHDKWQPYVGMDQIILLSDGRNGLLENKTQLDLAITNGSNVSSFSELVRPSNGAVFFGLKYRAANHWLVDLSYHHGRKSYLNYAIARGDYFEYHRFFRLGMQYRF